MVKRISIIFVFVFLGAVSLLGQCCDSLKLMANCFEGTYNHVTHKDTLTYIATTNSIIAYNTKNPDSPVRLSRTFLEGDINFVYAYENYLFVSVYTMGTLIYDVTNPKELVLLSSVPRPSEDICVKNGYLYIARYTNIFIYNISDILSPVYVNAITVKTDYYEVNIDVNGSRLYASANFFEDHGYMQQYEGVLVVYNISVSGNLTEVYRKDVVYPYDIAFNNGYIYLAARDGLYIYADYSSSTGRAIDSDAVRLIMADDALIGCSNDNLCVYDASKPESLQLTQDVSGLTIWDLSCDGEFLFTVGGDEFKSYYFYMDKLNLRFSLLTEKSFSEIRAYNGRVYLGQLPEDISIVRLDDNFLATKIGTIEQKSAKPAVPPSDGNINGEEINYVCERMSLEKFDIFDNYLFILKNYFFDNYIWYSMYTYLDIYDVSSAIPVKLKTFSKDEPYLTNMLIADKTVFLTGEYSYDEDRTTFHTCSAVDFAEQSTLDTFSMNYVVTDIASDEDMLFFAAKSGEMVSRNLTTYEAHPIEKEHQVFTDKYITKMSVDMPYISVITNDNWLYMLEYSRNTVSIEKKDSIFGGTQINSLKFINKNIYLCCGEQGIKLFKFEGDSITLLDAFITGYNTYSSAIDKERLYVSDPATGLWIFYVEYDPDEIVLPEVSDDRVQFDLLMLSGSLQKVKMRNFDEGEYTFEIKDIAGKTIRKENVEVDGAFFEKEISTEKLASGVYFLIVRDDDVFVSKKMLRF